MAKIAINLKRPKRPRAFDEEGLKRAPAPESAEWEAICLRCGVCCYDKLVDDDDNLIGVTPCRHLDLETRLCAVYERRFEIELDCIKLSPEKLASFDWLPDSCGYVVYFSKKKNKK